MKIANLFIGIGIGFICLLQTSLSQAQINSDGTLSTDVESQNDQKFVISGGRQAGRNLFHSFREFSVPTGGEAVFHNTPEIQNIFSRVTGNSISYIDGLIKANGAANLFFINPNGIIFGSNAQLNIGGSFIASTAEEIKFADGTSFSATDSQVEPVLTISMPIGLQFRSRATTIENRAFGDAEEGSSNFQVTPGKTLAFIGGDILLTESGSMVARGGRIELGSVAPNNFVSLTPVPTGWALGYESVQNFQDIYLSGAYISTSGFNLTEPSGSISLYGRRVTITDQSSILSLNTGTFPNEMILIKASEAVEVTNNSLITTSTFDIGAGGDIKIETTRFTINNGSLITTGSQGGDGRGGNLSVNASESVVVDGMKIFAQLGTNTLIGAGQAGNLDITTKRLIIRDGGRLLSNTQGSGNAGTINITASESVEARGQGKIEGLDTIFFSGLFSSTSSEGNGGNINIDTKRLLIGDGARLSVSARENSTGQAGNINIRAAELLEVRGIGSALLANSQSPKPAGNLFINTGQLNIENGGEVSVSATGEGAAGNLLINAASIRFNNGVLSAETRSGEGNINLQTQNIILRNNSQITTNATGEATGGNITINTDVLAALENSDITANAEDARGGKVTINAQGIFRTQDSNITATSTLGSDFSGTVILNIPDTDPNRGIVKLSETTVDPNSLIAQNPCQKGTESQFTITGRGSLPPSVNEDLSTGAVMVGLVEPTSTPSTGQQPPTQPNSATTQKPVIPAQGWVFNEKGEIVLTAYNPHLTQQERLPPKSQSCPTPSTTQK